MNSQNMVGILLCLVLLNTNTVTCITFGDVVVGALVGGAVIVGGPLVLGAVGFTGAGITAGSVAAGMMSTAAVTNGGAVAAGSTVAVLQSVGAAGFAAGTKAAIVAGTTGLYATVEKFYYSY
ncbi:hypothetical protein LOTGIDRAFT_176462 [Lottia gigantea]|uniref:Uncharacterized protein n=1 Tax=Lottia gigantea TaxID=225164 RepID=V4CFV8_LOTGI|nr:hypothetical protein LOTGIDRAFT_176462 [Lottia gigantea]ESP00920.1 hypothetical protein LOTGIDRAFT_176462 [Lottia gigantea]